MTDQVGNAAAEDGVGQQVRGIIAEFFAIDPASVTSATTAEDIPGWDSTTHVGLILAIEDALEIEFAVDQVTDFDDVGQLVATCAALSAGQA